MRSVDVVFLHLPLCIPGYLPDQVGCATYTMCSIRIGRQRYVPIL